ncbi:tellurite resistance protein TehB [Nautilia profundicola AmH]|uniref:Tellurite resistance protein TehB n=1 Tax=Nautilia profundicola (strain ATCC BAA-1463 / DSM 18972 / AmH) TaxID=598659 RepID=B9L8Q4_NAUPA|nr:class I SAM-dependent methyltransferase [Nautilia profundicola]ACM92611.1 tellurite resistance protein TehB [Nautilia profundicola AmH]
MIEEKLKWNEKYKTLTPKPPSVLINYIPTANAKALDLAGGYGRNAKALADKGYDVTLIDISEIGISKINDNRIKTFCLDLDSYMIPKNEYDVILMIKYFNLNLLKQIPSALKKGGYFVFETIRKYPISKEEFFEIFKDFEVIYFSEKPFRFIGKLFNYK